MQRTTKGTRAFIMTQSMLCLLLLLLPCTTAHKKPAKRTTFRDCNGSIRHAHLAVGKDPSNSMTVSFSGLDSGKWEPFAAAILLGTDPRRLNIMVREEEGPTWYEALQPRNKPNYTSPYQHHVTLTDLQPSTTYYYQCIVRPKAEGLNHLEKTLEQDFDDDRDSNEKEELIGVEVNDLFGQESNLIDRDGTRRNLLHQRARQYERERQFLRRLAPPPYDSTQCKCPDPNQIRSFKTAPLPGTMPQKPLKFAIIGDIGQFAHSEETLDHLIRENGENISAILLAGDIAYSEGDHHRWDTFMDFLDDYPIAAHVPMMITPGNHDIDKPTQGFEIFQAYESRFRMPHLQAAKRSPIMISGDLNMDRPPYPLPYDYGNAFYSFTWGTARFIVLNSYSAMEPHSIMYQWFLDELEAIDRTSTPWLFVMLHCPIYNTFTVHQKDYQILKTREHLEPLFVQYKVNMIFNGHVHAYLRTLPVAFQVPQQTGPIHVVMGAGGRDAEAAYLSDEPEVWVATRDASIYGYGLLEIYNATHLRWDWIHTGTPDDHHSNTVFGQNITLPVGGVDGLVVENQYFIE